MRPEPLAASLIGLLRAIRRGDVGDYTPLTEYILDAEAALRQEPFAPTVYEPGYLSNALTAYEDETGVILDPVRFEHNIPKIPQEPPADLPGDQKTVVLDWQPASSPALTGCYLWDCPACLRKYNIAPPEVVAAPEIILSCTCGASFHITGMAEPPGTPRKGGHLTLIVGGIP